MPQFQVVAGGPGGRRRAAKSKGSARSKKGLHPNAAESPFRSGQTAAELKGASNYGLFCFGNLAFINPINRIGS
jgi:hypothetical protein